MRNWIAVLGLLSIAVATAAEEVNVRLTDVPRQVRLPLPDGENAILTAPVDGKVRSLWLARSLDARARYLLDRVGEGVYQVNLADPVLAAMLEASGAGQVRVFAEAPDGTVSASIPVSYAVRTSAREWHRPPRVFVHTEEKTTELSWWARGWDPDRLALLAEIRGQGMAITAPDLSGLPFGPGGKDITGWFEPSEVKLIEVRFDPGADRTSARAGAGERQWEFARADSGEGRHELAVTTPVRRAWEQAGELAAPRRQPDADFFVDVYVSVGDANAADAPGRGTTSLPYKSIQYALDHSSGTETRPVAIHVAAGTYADRIVLDENDQYTSILGGYNADDWSDRAYERAEDREDVKYRTVVTGDVNGDGRPDVRCFYIAREATKVLLSGLVIKSGLATKTGPALSASGGGVYVAGGTIEIECCTVSGNLAPKGGGGVYNGGDLTVRSCLITGNQSASDRSGHGGGIYNRRRLHVSSTTISHNSAAVWGGGICDRGLEMDVHSSTIDGNSARKGGGIWTDSHNSSKSTLTSSTISRNLAQQDGGGIRSGGVPVVIHSCRIVGNSAGGEGAGLHSLYGSVNITSSVIGGNSSSLDGGGIWCLTDLNVETTAITGNSSGRNGGGVRNESRVTVASSLISGNKAKKGGGVFNGESWTGSQRLKIACSTVVNNWAARGGGVYNAVGRAKVTITNSILWGNSTPIEGQGDIAVTYCDVQGGWFGVGNVDADPGFASLERGDFHLTASSACIDMGNNELVPEGLTVDIEGTARIVDGRADIPQAHVDMGAFEYDGRRLLLRRVGRAEPPGG